MKYDTYLTVVMLKGGAATISSMHQVLIGQM